MDSRATSGDGDGNGVDNEDDNDEDDGDDSDLKLCLILTGFDCCNFDFDNDFFVVATCSTLLVAVVDGDG